MTNTSETHEFQAEVRQILDLVIHSLYSNREIVLRELISNAADAADKLRFEALQDDALLAGDTELRVRIRADEEANTLTISDNGIGMSRQEVIDNLGTIARSGTRQFVEALSGDQASDSQLIGQFGVGFYSAFIVADRVQVITRRADADDAVQWISTGTGEFSIESVAREGRGTDVILHLKEDAKDFVEPHFLRNLISKYSDHISLPVQMPDAENADEWETVNQASALWMRPKADIKDEEYQALYKHIGHDFEDPLLWAHNRVEGANEYTALLFIPQRAPFDLWDRDQRRGLKLYVKRVFIMDDAENLMPSYLRFVRGVIDSDDLPLNVSRELLQKNRVIDRIRSASTKRVLSLLESLAKEDADKYQRFWDEFGRVIKEGPAEDNDNRDRIAKLLRFASTHGDGKKQDVSLEDYVGRMAEGQDKIYFITADNTAAALGSPHMEMFRDKGIEVLLLTDRVDEWLISALSEYEGKTLQSVTRSDVDFDKLAGSDAEKTDESESQRAEPSDEDKALLARVEKALGEKIKSANASERLKSSPACLVGEAYDMSANLERILREAGQAVPERKPILELNLAHPLVKQLSALEDGQPFDEWAQLLFDEAVLSEGGQLADPVAFVGRINALLADTLETEA